MGARIAMIASKGMQPCVVGPPDAGLASPSGQARRAAGASSRGGYEGDGGDCQCHTGGSDAHHAAECSHHPNAFATRLAARYPSLVIELLLFLAGIVGGALNSLAGGGSFVVFPALLAAGVPPVVANASNTYAALPGYASGVLGYWKDVVKYRERFVLYAIIAAIFGYAGAELLLHVSDKQFSYAVPWLILFAVVLFAFGSRINAFVSTLSGRRGARAAGAVLLLAMLAAISVYGGFFNAGLGILLLAFLVLAGIDNIHAANGLKMLISVLIALVAVVRFAINGSIDWYHGSIALVGVTIGSYVAARLAYRIPTKVIRALVIVYGAGLTIYFFWKTYWA